MKDQQPLIRATSSGFELHLSVSTARAVSAALLASRDENPDDVIEAITGLHKTDATELAARISYSTDRCGEDETVRLSITGDQLDLLHLALVDVIEILEPLEIQTRHARLRETPPVDE